MCTKVERGSRSNTCARWEFPALYITNPKLMHFPFHSSIPYTALPSPLPASGRCIRLSSANAGSGSSSDLDQPESFQPDHTEQQYRIVNCNSSHSHYIQFHVSEDHSLVLCYLKGLCSVLRNRPAGTRRVLSGYLTVWPASTSSLCCCHHSIHSYKPAQKESKSRIYNLQHSSLPTVYTNIASSSFQRDCPGLFFLSDFQLRRGKLAHCSGPESVGDVSGRGEVAHIGISPAPRTWKAMMLDKLPN